MPSGLMETTMKEITLGKIMSVVAFGTRQEEELNKLDRSYLGFVLLLLFVFLTGPASKSGDWGNFGEVITCFLSHGSLCLSEQPQMQALLSLLHAVCSLPASPSGFGLSCQS